MQVAGLKRSDYLLPGQLCYGHNDTIWFESSYTPDTGADKGITGYYGHKFLMNHTDPKAVKGEYKRSSFEEDTFYKRPEYFSGPTPKIFNV